MNDDSVMVYQTYFSPCRDYLCDLFTKEQIEHWTERDWGGGPWGRRRQSAYRVYVSSKDLQRSRELVDQHIVALSQLGASVSSSLFGRLLLAAVLLVALIVMLTYFTERG